MQPLSNLKVIDLTHLVVGPFSTKLISDLGAEVIKVENPWGGDKSRRMPPFFHDEPQEEKSGLFLWLNTNKKSITLNLKAKTGKEILGKLVSQADMVVENFSPRVMPSLGLSYESLKEIKDDIVMVSISNFGQSGPYRDYKATDLGLLAFGGVLYLTGTKNKPVKLGGFQAQYLAGWNASIAMLTAVYTKMNTGTGQHVDVSIMDCLASFSAFQGWAPYAYMGVNVRREFFKRFVTGHPVGLYPCKDGYVVVVPGLGGMSNLALLLEKPELAEHPLFTNAWSRQENAEEFDKTFLIPWLKEHNCKEAVSLAQELRMPFSEMQTVGELLGDPQLESRQFFTSSKHPIVGDLVYPKAAFHANEMSSQVGAAPLLGGNNEEIYCRRLGYSKQDLIRFREQEII